MSINLKFISIFFLFIFLWQVNTYAQSDSLNAPYVKQPHIPAFTIFKAPDSSAFSKNDIKRNFTTVFIMFNPDCEFCQHETRDLLKNISKFKKTHFIMVSSRPLKLITDFYIKYNLASYPFITVGKDNNYFFFKFFKLHIAPCTFIYDKHGDLKKSFTGIVSAEKILKEL